MMPRGNMLDEAVMLDEGMMFLRKKGGQSFGWERRVERGWGAFVEPHG
ncbi:MULTISPECIES: hypothetical protein [unclassified Bartonella]